MNCYLDMNSGEILTIVSLYLFIGGIVGSILEEKGWISVHATFGYTIVSIFWLPLVVIFSGIILGKIIAFKLGRSGK